MKISDLPPLTEIKNAFPQVGNIERMDALRADGSERSFFRVYARDAKSFVLVKSSDAKASSVYAKLAQHLAQREVRVPALLGEDHDRAWLLFEDLGNKSLFSAAKEADSDVRKLDELYVPAIDLLAEMQVRGAEGFNCSAWPSYGAEVMVEREGMYFADEFASGLLGIEIPSQYRREIELFADYASSARTDFFMHRDFQSRNIMLTRDGPAVIDFQDGRRGPLAYDAASLILDPYVDLPATCRARLKTRYGRKLNLRGTAEEDFEEEWRRFGAFRLLQTLGAFAKLGGRMGKPGFLEYAATGLEILLNHLGEEGKNEIPAVFGLVERCRDLWAEKQEKAASG